MKFLLIGLIQICLAVNVLGQLPYNDSAWQYQAAESDDFNGSVLNTTKWWSDNQPNVWTYLKPTNVQVNNGKLKLLVDTLIPAGVFNNMSYYYQGGDVVSQLKNFKYGYLEILAKYPVGHYAYWPAFWIFNDSCGFGSYSWYNEVDICENGSIQSKSGHQMGTNIWQNNITSCSPVINNPYTVNDLPKLDSAFHYYGIEWNPDFINYYFDNVMVRTYDATLFRHNMEVIIDFMVQRGYPNWGDPLPKDTSQFPAIFEIEYFNYYKLITHCSLNKNICSVINYDRGVYKSIEVAGLSCGASTSFNTSDQYSLRATDYVLLDEGSIIVDNGGVNGHFSILVNSCPN
jgi:beta-glucanase (GH16 family)